MRQRHAVTKKMAAAYKRETKSKKSMAHYSPVELTDWHRDHACHSLKEADTSNLERPQQCGNSNRLRLLHVRRVRYLAIWMIRTFALH